MTALHERLLALAEELGELAETLHDPTFSTVLAAAEEARAIATELEQRGMTVAEQNEVLAKFGMHLMPERIKSEPEGLLWHVAGVGPQAHACRCILQHNHA